MSRLERSDGRARRRIVRRHPCASAAPLAARSASGARSVMRGTCLQVLHQTQSPPAPSAPAGSLLHPAQSVKQGGKTSKGWQFRIRYVVWRWLSSCAAIDPNTPKTNITGGCEVQERAGANVHDVLD